MLRMAFKLVLADVLLLIIAGFIIPHQFGGVSGGLVNSLELFNKIILPLLNINGYGIIGIAGLIIFIAIIYYILNKNNYSAANSFIRFIVAFILSIFILSFIVFGLGVFLFTGFGLFK